MALSCDAIVAGEGGGGGGDGWRDILDLRGTSIVMATTRMVQSLAVKGGGSPLIVCSLHALEV